MTSDFSVALHILGFLTASDGKPLTSEILAETYGTNPVVVRRVLSKLKEAGFVSTQRGTGGGSVLAQDSTGITLRQVFESVHEKPGILPRPPGETGTVSKILSDYVNDLFTHAEAALLADLDRTTISEMDEKVRPEICAFLCQREK